MKTIIAAFCDGASAQRALQFLETRDTRDTQLFTYEDGEPLNRLTGLGIPDERAQLYAEIMRRGAYAIITHANDDDAAELANQLDNMGSLDLDAAEARWRAEGWSGYDPSSLPFDANQCASEQARLREESLIATSEEAAPSAAPQAAPPAAPPIATSEQGGSLDVVEEHMRVGKREVPRGGVRVRTFIMERPVHEQVQLREERIEVEREPVNEPISPQAAEATFTEDEFVVTAQGEEAVVGTEARVVERVHVGKTTETRTETVEGTDRRRDVEVEPIEERKSEEREPGRRS